MTRLSALLAASAAAFAVLLPVQPASAASTDYRIGDNQPVDSVNPFKELNEISYDITSMSYDLLLNYRTADGQPDLQHSLASAYHVSPDAKTWTFTLHSGITWSDGKPFTSADVKWTYDAVRENKTNVMNAYLANVKSVDTPNATTVVLHLSAPDVRISSIFVPILPQHVFAQYPIKQLDKITLPLPSVTTAPYQITSWNKDGTTVLTANPSFRGPKPVVQRVLITHYSNQDGVLRDLKLGSLDMIVDGDVRWASQLKSNASVRTWSASSPGFQEIAFNSCPLSGAGDCGKPGPDVNVKVVQDHAIREALAYGINRPDIAQANYAGQSQPADGLISPFYSTYYKDWSHDPQIGYQYNQAKARQVLAAGGWDCSSSPCVKDGTKAAFTLYVRTNDEPGQNAMRRVVAEAGQIGIKITLSIVTEDALNNKIYAPGKGGTYDPDYDAFYWAWTGDPTPDFDFSVLNTGSAWTDSYYSNKAYDALTKQALQTPDHAQRADLLHRAERIAMTDLPYIPIVYSNSFDVTRTDTWHGYQPSPTTNGTPIGTNWLQLTSLRPGAEPAPSTPGAPTIAPVAAGGGDNSGGVPVPATILLAVGIGVIGYLLGWRTHRRRV
ncbi:MAG TPA: ABC transporter substrate-binding protein, partial [Jatrophihabitantaceae bacterium]|nr:ABC transporter substrate-binding protein [Jatrophihabitantaceae bacterium]